MSKRAPRAEISEGRQTIYYLGMALSILGAVLFLSVLVQGFAGFGSGRERPTVWVSPGSDVERFRGPLGIPPDAIIREGSPGSSPASSASPSSGPDPMRAIAGFILVMIGGAMMNVGAAGLRGSGMILDPHGAREDLKPYSQASGGMLDDALGSSEIVNRVVDRSVQLAGGMGTSEDMVLGRIYADIRAFRIYDGASEVHRMSLAKRAARRATS